MSVGGSPESPRFRGVLTVRLSSLSQEIYQLLPEQGSPHFRPYTLA